MFEGYRRPDGKVGIRNHVLILPVSLCASETARVVSDRVKGSVYIPNQGGCAQVKGDLEIILEALSGLAANPNVYGTVVIGLGCEGAQADIVIERIRKKTNKPLERVVIQEVGGTIKAVETASRYAMHMVREASKLKREEFDYSYLLVGTECGGSDPTSGLAANPVIGNLCDRLIAAGGSSILSETTEFIGAEEILKNRTAAPEVANKLLQIIRRYEEHIQRAGENLRMGNPTPGNVAGGITTLEEKSLGCIHKGGHTTIMEVVDYCQIPNQKGLIVMDTPGQDLASITGMAAGGAQIVLFTTGRGTPTGYGILPVIKLTGNKHTYEAMVDNIDFDASGVIDGSKTIEQLGGELLREMMEVVNGKATKAEALGFNDMSISRLCNFV